MSKKQPSNMVQVAVFIPKGHIKLLDELVKKAKMYPNRNEAIRFAIRDLIKAERCFLEEDKK